MIQNISGLYLSLLISFFLLDSKHSIASQLLYGLIFKLLNNRKSEITGFMVLFCA